MDVVTAIEGGLVVSCQAPEGHPLRDPRTIALLARCAELGGAAGLRVNGPEDVRAVKAVTGLPLIGLAKVPRPHSRPLITPTFALCESLVRAGADMVALEVTAEAEPEAGDLPSLVERVWKELGVPVMADVSTAEEGLLAWNRGAALISTTLAGYTPYTVPAPPADPTLHGAHALAGAPSALDSALALAGDPAVTWSSTTTDPAVPLRAAAADFTSRPGTGAAPRPGLPHEPDLDLVGELAALGVRTVAEGRLRTDAHVAEAFARGAWSVVIGAAITDPLALTRHLTAATPRASR
ncbi:N-acetylmannosamine-6-phosphate 2-epimerase [Nonomuraea sp. NPDC050227]|uniref:N-acetylmannosamine-6-phosphate 2-epimerase n=1 Tax=Nonomuraea sp. NPDC050227 TaxID=3364360 RepID=UPI0037AA733E